MSRRPRKKLIQYGWGSRDTQYVRDHWQQMQTTPFDGVGILVAVDRVAWNMGSMDTDNQLGWLAMGTQAFNFSSFRETVDDLQSAFPTALTDNFLPLIFAGPSSIGLNFYDDNRWETIINNIDVLSRIAGAGGVKGFLLDPEHYSVNLFDYAPQNAMQAHSFRRYQQKARQRGNEVMNVMKQSLSTPILLSLWSYTKTLAYTEGGTPLAQAAYGLLPAFFDGLLEAMPAGGQLIDGYEFSYHYTGAHNFQGDYDWIHQTAKTLSQVPADYGAKVRASFGLWPDFDQNVNFRTPLGLQQIITNALKASDRYVWLYDQVVDFFPLSGVYPDPSVPDYYFDAFRAARAVACCEEV